MEPNEQSYALPHDFYWAAVPTDRLADVIRAKALAHRKRLSNLDAC